MNKLFSILGTSLLLSFGFTSCISTETVESPAPQESDEITLLLNTEEVAGTKAGENHDGHFLRYVAKLFKLSGNDITSSMIPVRQELKASDGDNSITFKVDPNSTYKIIVFADYIPESSLPGDDGTYEDFYYDTHADNEYVSVKTDESNLARLINNDNLDFFCTDAIKINKTEEKVEQNITLKRVTSKIRFVAKVGNDTEADPQATVTISKFDQKGKINTNMVSAPKNTNAASLLSKQTYSLTNEKVAENELELFYFYTFAQISSQELSEFEFTVNLSDGTLKKVTIPTGKITYSRNYITTVKGAFIPSSNDDNPGTGDDGPGESEDHTGDIVLNLTTDQNWSGNQDFEFAVE